MSSNKIPQLIWHILDLAGNPELVFSDVHIEEDELVMMRTPNGLQPSGWAQRVTAQDLSDFLAAFNPLAEQKLDASGAAEESKQFEGVRLRCSAYTISCQERMAISVRVLQKEPPTLQETGLPMSVARYVTQPRGLLLVTGPTGSGKSTTIGAFLREINEKRSAHVVTVEDPIEYTFQRKKAVFSQRHVGLDVASYSQGLHEALRQRPDVIVIGEIRDRDTAETALRAAESGHFVIASMHARNCASAVGRLVSLFDTDGTVAARNLASCLVGVISQCLVPTTKGTAVLAAEVLLGNDPKVEEFIGTLNFKKINEHLAQNQQKGGTYMNHILANLVRAKTVTAEAALAHSPNVQELFDRINNPNQL